MKRILAVISFLCLGLVASCGGGGGGNDGGQVTVAVSPSTASVIAGQTQQFTAAVSGALNSSVTWSVSCSNSSCGSINSSGLYTAPSPIPSSTTVTVRATSQEDTNIVGTATVTQNPVSMIISPISNLTLISADTQQFTATISNAPTGHATYTWSVNGNGSVSSGGLYSAPAKVASDGSATITVTSDFDTTKSASAGVSLKAPVITLAPGNMTMDGGGQQQFTPTVVNVPAGQSGVHWQLSGHGSIASGMYHAPDLVAAQETATIMAILDFDNTKTAQSVVTMNPLTVTVAPKTATVYPTQTRQFSATVGNHVNRAVTWSVVGAACGGGACGTIDGNGLYSAPNSVSAEFQVNVVATSLADPSRSDTAVVTLEPITVTVSPKTATVNVSMTQQFAAVVDGSSNQNVTWSVAGAGCSGNACGNITTSTGLYTAPGTPPAPPTVTVTASAVADPTRTDTATVTIVNDPNVKLSGGYAFIYSGFDASGRSLDAIGNMIADGAGHLTGYIDMNGANGAYRIANSAFTGTYQVNANDNRGQMIFNLPSGAWTFRFAISSTGSRGHFLLFESTGRYGSGIFKRVNASDFSLTALSGNLAFGITGLSAQGDVRNAIAGRMHVDSNGAISATSAYSVSSGDPTNFLTFDGTLTMNASTGVSHGRGTMALSVGGTSPNFAYYMIDDTEAYMLRTDVIGDNNPAYVGGMMKQRLGEFLPAHFTGNSVFYLTGFVRQTVPKAGVMIGQMTMTDGSVGSSSYTYNYGGSIFSGSSTITATVYTNGRVLLNILGNSYAAYLVAPNTGFMLHIDSPGTMALFGFFEAQSGGPFGYSSLNGEFFGGAVAPATGLVGYGNGLQRYDGLGGWSGTGNTIGPGSGMQPDVAVAGTYNITNATTGEANWQGTFPGVYNKKFYVIDPNRIVFVQTEPSNTQPSVEIFEK